MFSSKSKKETEADGSSVEERSEKAGVKGEASSTKIQPYCDNAVVRMLTKFCIGAGAANMNARGEASAEQKDRQMRIRNDE